MQEGTGVPALINFRPLRTRLVFHRLQPHWPLGACALQLLLVVPPAGAEGPALSTATAAELRTVPLASSEVPDTPPLPRDLQGFASDSIAEPPVDAHGEALAVPGDQTGSFGKLVVSGGVSLGSYIGGFTYYLTLARQQRFAVSPDSKPAWDLTSGTSAGAINAVLGAVAGCSAPEWDPQQSLFYRVWIPVGLDTLARTEDVTSRSLLSRAPLEGAAREIEGYFRGRDESDAAGACNTVIATVATRTHPRNYTLKRSGDMATPQVETPPRVPRLTEKFVLRLRRRRGSLVLESLVPENEMESYLSLGTGELSRAVGWAPGLVSARVTFQDLKRLLFASAAVPLAFEPQVVAYRMAGQVDYDEFVDGAVFENVPIGLALRVSRNTQGMNRLMVIDPDVRSWVKLHDVGGSSRRTLHEVVPWAIDFAGGALGAFRGTELSTAFDDRIRNDPNVVLKHLPRSTVTAGEQLGYFGAFLDESFRFFDFYVGMLDASAQVGDLSGGRSEPGWGPFACAREWDAATGHFDHWPASDALAACTALAGTPWSSDERMWTGSSVGTPEANFPRFLAASLELRQRERSVPEAAPDYLWFSTIKKHGVRTRAGVEDQQPAIALRDKLEPLLAGMTSKQDGFANKLVVKVGARALLDTVYYRDPPLYGGVGVGTVRGVDMFLGGYGSHRLAGEAAFEFSNLTLLNERKQMRFRPFLRLVVSTLRRALIQLEAFAGVGAEVAVNEEQRDKHLAPATQLGLRFGVLHRISITLAGEAVIPQLSYQWDEDFSGNWGRAYLSFGLRFPKFGGR